MRPSMVIIRGAHFCSSHALEVTMQQVSPALVLDLRGCDSPMVDLDPSPEFQQVDALAS